MGADGSRYLLYSLYHLAGFSHATWPKVWIGQTSNSFLLHVDSHVPKFVSKPNSLLLEDQGSTASTQRNDQTTEMLLLTHYRSCTGVDSSLAIVI